MPAGFAMNPFDAAVYVCLIVAVVMGFKSGLLRALATIIGYLAAAPFAVAVAPALALFLGQQFHMPQLQPWPVLVGLFAVAGLIVGALLRRAITDLVGEKISIPDRLAGATLGAVRVGLLAVLMVIIFDRIIPPNVQPGFLAGSRLRPILSVAGQQGLRSLPPDVADYIDRVKRARGI
jgi:membrane protein required for colicin V production